jgi:glycosyltransferase involved in cell wall biosynthesis
MFDPSEIGEGSAPASTVSNSPAMEVVRPKSIDSDISANPRVVVALPVRNEAARIGACLHALAVQAGAAVDRVVLLLNNCTDDTRACADASAAALGLTIECVERTLYGVQASAGFARRLAMQHAASGLTDRDILTTTDADGRVAPNWVAETRRALGRGVDAVCGRAVIDPTEAQMIPASLHADDALELRLGGLLDEITWLLDPVSYDPWPRHSEHSGASIAVTVAAWRRAGGMPALSSGEDRAFIDKIRYMDGRVRHPKDVWVTVSGRLEGRAEGGMADTMRRRIVRQDEFTDSTIEPARLRYRRIVLRAQARALWDGCWAESHDFARAAGVPRDVVRAALDCRFFGRAWEILERACPFLSPRRVRFTELPREIEIAETICCALRAITAPADACNAVPAQP